MRNRSVAGIALTCVGLSACGGSEPRQHGVLDTAAQPLRAQFDADSGKVRDIFIASPT